MKAVTGTVRGWEWEREQLLLQRSLCWPLAAGRWPVPLLCRPRPTELTQFSLRACLPISPNIRGAS